jgi:hypothetical protein
MHENGATAACQEQAGFASAASRRPNPGCLCQLPLPLQPLPHLQSPQVTLPLPLHSKQGGSAMDGLKVGTPRCVCTGSGFAAARCGSGKMGLRMREPCCCGGAGLLPAPLLLLLGSSNKAAGRHLARLCRRHGVPLSHGCGREINEASMRKVIRHN